mmetsp:Transcript_31868/g.75691  ORF Transcript_31868/g.75691 Transcript_31868/m.75691 type:complete len:203 (-) Transcript_31868:545-1153(-)
MRRGGSRRGASSASARWRRRSGFRSTRASGRCGTSRGSCRWGGQRPSRAAPSTRRRAPRCSASLGVAWGRPSEGAAAAQEPEAARWAGGTLLRWMCMISRTASTLQAPPRQHLQPLRRAAHAAPAASQRPWMAPCGWGTARPSWRDTRPAAAACGTTSRSRPSRAWPLWGSACGRGSATGASSCTTARARGSPLGSHTAGRS